MSKHTKYTIELNHDEVMCLLSALKTQKDKKHSEDESAITELSLGNKITDIINNTKTYKLENMQNERLLNKIENLNETVHDLECQIRDLKNNRNVKIADFFTSYSNIKNRYDSNNVEYQMKHINDITKIFGVEMQQVKGFSDLTEEDQAIFSQGILEFLNGYGLGNRIQHLPVKVWKEANILKFLTLTGGDKEQWMDLKGNIL